MCHLEKKYIYFCQFTLLEGRKQINAVKDIKLGRTLFNINFGILYMPNTLVR